MPVRYRIDILAALKEKGFSTYRIRKEKLLATSTVQNIKNGDPISWANIEQLCNLLNCQPGDILEYVPADDQDDPSQE